MNPRIITVIFSLAACGLLIAAASKQRDVFQLRVEEEQLAAQAATADLAAAEPDIASAAEPDAAAKSELLRLRNEVGQLMQRRKDLAALRAEVESLKAQLAGKTNSAAALPPDYIRTRDAQWMGMNTPENTLQSMLWALHKRDAQTMLQLFTPDAAERLAKQLNENTNFFEASLLPGMRPIKREQLPNGTIKLHVEINPGANVEPAPIPFQNINGAWRISDL